MKRNLGADFELPDDFVIGGTGDEANDARMGAGSTLPQDLFPLGAPGASPSALGARADQLDTGSAPDAPTLPAALQENSSPPIFQAILAGQGAKGRMPGDGPQPKRVLVVDDDLTARLYLRSRLMLRGNVQLVEAADGAQAMDILQAQSFDALLLDVDMGTPNGFEVCSAARRFARNRGDKQPRIYLVTSRSNMLDKMRGKLVGADEFLTKPPQPAEFARLLAQL